jgi:hypothetical protein
MKSRKGSADAYRHARIKCGVDSPAIGSQSKRPPFTPHFVQLGISENKVRLGLSRIIQRKENAPEFDYSSFYAKTGAGDPLLCGGGLAFLRTCPRAAAHEETELLTVLKIPFRVRTPFTADSTPPEISRCNARGLPFVG